MTLSNPDFPNWRSTSLGALSDSRASLNALNGRRWFPPWWYFLQTFTDGISNVSFTSIARSRHYSLDDVCTPFTVKRKMKGLYLPISPFPHHASVVMACKQSKTWSPPAWLKISVQFDTSGRIGFFFFFLLDLFLLQLM